MYQSTINVWKEGNSKTVYSWVVIAVACAELSLKCCARVQCFFCNNQYRSDAAYADDLETVFKARLKGIGRMVAMLDTWTGQVYLTRVWCKY